MSDDHVLRFYQERLAVLASRVRAAGVRGEDAIDDLPARLAADPLHEAAADERCADQVVPVGHGDRDAVVRDEIATLARVGEVKYARYSPSISIIIGTECGPPSGRSVATWAMFGPANRAWLVVEHNHQRSW